MTLPAFRIAATTGRPAHRRALDAARQGSRALGGVFCAVASRRYGRELCVQAESAAGAAAQLAERLGGSSAIDGQTRIGADKLFMPKRHPAERWHARAVGTRAAPSSPRTIRCELRSTLPRYFRRCPRASHAASRTALDRRIDLQIARIELDLSLNRTELTNATRFVNVLEDGYADRQGRPRHGVHSAQPRLHRDVRNSVFDFGEVRVREASRPTCRRPTIGPMAVQCALGSADAYRGYRTSYDIAARYQREILPLRKAISEK